MVKKKLTQLLAVSAISFAGFGGQAFAACSIKAWDTSSTGKAESAAAPQNAIRYEGLCSLNGATGMVTKKLADKGDGNTYVRFYMFSDTVQSATVFKASGGGKSVSIKGNDVPALTAKKWHNVQLHIGKTQTKVWVDKADTKGTPDKTIASGIDSITDIALGKVSGTVSGKLYFDSVAVSNGTPINNGAVNKGVTSTINGKKVIIPGDADGKNGLDILDAIAILREDSTNAGFNKVGSPDCNLDGSIDILDAICALRKAP